jgi:hypothetical protein
MGFLFDAFFGCSRGKHSLYTEPYGTPSGAVYRRFVCLYCKRKWNLDGFEQKPNSSWEGATRSGRKTLPDKAIAQFWLSQILAKDQDMSQEEKVVLTYLAENSPEEFLKRIK